MLVFIDESGDPGFKIPKGSSPLFVAAMVTFADSDKAAHATKVIATLAKDLRVRPEFKFSQCRNEVRDAFFSGIAALEFSVRAVVVKKDLIYSKHLRTERRDFYRYFVKSLIKNSQKSIVDARIVIDGSGDRLFREDLKSYLKQQNPVGLIRDVRFKNSKADGLVQLADMCAGAIARSYRSDRKDTSRWRQALAHHVADIWEFK